MAERLTVLIPCKNEERNIRPCIESVKPIADELLVADSGSADRTMEIARELGARVIEREYVNSADFKNWAIPQAAHEWVFVLDSDERVTPELAREIEKVLAEGPKRDAYRVYRLSFFLGHPVRRCGWDKDSVIRLFRRDVCRYEEKRVHAGLLVSTGRVGRLRRKLEHYTYWSFDQYFEKFGRYTTWAAEDLCEKGRRSGLLSLTVRPAWHFFRHYVLQRGFLEGRKGLIISALGAFSVFTKYARLWGLYKGRPEPDPEARLVGTGRGPDDAAEGERDCE
jgi:glycosyltransferase involved in cell wall biosynthesis